MVETMSDTPIKLWKTVVFDDHRRGLDIVFHLYEDQDTGEVEFTAAIREQHTLYGRWEPPLRLKRVEP